MVKEAVLGNAVPAAPRNRVGTRPGIEGTSGGDGDTAWPETRPPPPPGLALHGGSDRL